MKIWLIGIFTAVFLIPVILITVPFLYEFRHAHAKKLNVVEISGIPVTSELQVRVSHTCRP